MSGTPDWAPLTRNYEKERLSLSLLKSEVTIHPLLTQKQRLAEEKKRDQASGDSTLPSVQISNPNSNKKRIGVVVDAFSDPLSMMADPLSAVTAPILTSAFPVLIDPLAVASLNSSKAPAMKNQSLEITRQTAKVVHEANLSSPWQLKKQQIIKEYAMAGNVTVNSSAIDDFAGSGVEDGSSNRHIDRYSQRLATLEQRQLNKSEKVELTQDQYEQHVMKLAADLNRAWAKDERVGSLKIAIQLAKLLSDTNVPQFYPSMFVRVTEVLDAFGAMVFNRLKSKAEETLNELPNTAVNNGKNPLPKKLDDDFHAIDIPQSAKETCRNWFYKVSCIRELLPRVYVEISLLKCYRFLTDDDYRPVLSRLASVIRGIGDPLVATYLRTYLVVVGNEIAPGVNAHAISMLEDIMFSSYMIKESDMQSELSRAKVTEKAYYYLLSPGIEWVIKCIGRHANRELFQTILSSYRQHSNDSLILKHIIGSFDASHYCHAALGMVSLIKSSTTSCYSQIDLFAALGSKLSIYPPPEDQRIPLLNDVWKIVIKGSDLLSYVRCCYGWIDLIQKYYSEKEMLILLSNLSTRLQNILKNGEVLTDAIQLQLESLISSLIGQSSTFGTSILTSEHLLKIMDLFKGTKKVALCKEVLESFRTQNKTNDAVLINSLFDLSRTVHDSIDCLSPEGERNYVTKLLGGFIDQIDFGKDLERQLNFYVECRAVFCNIELIKDKLIISIGNLIMKTLKLTKYKHTKKTATFVKGCLAYCHITIPSIANVYRKLQLLLYCSQISLVNNCLPQTDTFLKAAISLIPEMNSADSSINSDELLYIYLCNLLSTLVIVPGHPEFGPFYIIKGLMNAIPKYTWNNSLSLEGGVSSSNGKAYEIRVYVHMIGLLCTYAQKTFPYHINGMESNDDLYCNSENYLSELQEIIGLCMNSVLTQLTILSETSGNEKLKMDFNLCVLDTINVLSSHMELNPSLNRFLCRLFDLIYKNKSVFTRNDMKYYINTIQYIIDKLQFGHFLPMISSSSSSSQRAIFGKIKREMLADDDIDQEVLTKLRNYLS